MKLENKYCIIIDKPINVITISLLMKLLLKTISLLVKLLMLTIFLLIEITFY